MPEFGPSLLGRLGAEQDSQRAAFQWGSAEVPPVGKCLTVVTEILSQLKLGVFFKMLKKKVAKVEN